MFPTTSTPSWTCGTKLQLEALPNPCRWIAPHKNTDLLTQHCHVQTHSRPFCGIHTTWLSHLVSHLPVLKPQSNERELLQRQFWLILNELSKGPDQRGTSSLMFWVGWFHFLCCQKSESVLCLDHSYSKKLQFKSKNNSSLNLIANSPSSRCELQFFFP